MQQNAQFDTCKILGVQIAAVDMQKTLELLQKNLAAWQGEYICVSNVHTTVTAYDDQNYRAVQNGAVMALPDGGPLSAYARAHGYAQARRVTGPDLMREVLKKSEETGWKHYFYGSTPETLEMLKKKLAERYPGAQVVGMVSPPFRTLTPEEEAEAMENIRRADPDFIWVGLGAPKQERWMAAHRGQLPGIMLGVGAAFDYEAGNIKRAPQWMQRCSLEWFYRLMQDPMRLLPRYFKTNLRYLWLTKIRNK